MMTSHNKLWLGGAALLAVAATGLVATGKLPLLKKPGGAGVAAITPAISESAMAAAVTVMRASPADFVEQIMVTGSLVPRDEVLVGPEIEGLRIIEVLVDEGARVKKGQVLARLVSDTLEAQIAQSDAGLAKAKAAIAQAQSTITSAVAKRDEANNALSRGKPLRQSGYLSESTLDQRDSAAKTAEAQLVSARDGLKVSEADKAQIEAQRRELNWRRSRTDIAAPTDGLISRRVARVGGFAAGAGEPMFRIIAKGEIELDAEVIETKLAKIKEGMAVRIEVAGVSGDVVGKVRMLSPEVDKASRVGRIRVFLGDNPALRIGAFARGNIEAGKSRGLAVPASAVLYGETGASVQVVRENNTIETRRIRIGLAPGALVEVVDGLKDGDVVVSRAGTFLRDGDAVRPMFENQPKFSEVRR
jgi:HlyD family secretion protein